MSWKNILSLIKTQLGVTQSSLSSRKNLPSQTLLLKGFRKSHSPLEKLSQTHTQTTVFLCETLLTLHLILRLFVSLSAISVLFSPLSLSLSLCPLSTSLLCVSGKARLINDTRQRVRSEGWVSDKWLCWKGNRLSGMAWLFSSWIGFQDPWRPEQLSFPENSTHPTRL